MLDIEEGCYCMWSQSNHEKWFVVDLVACHCDCPSFPLVSFCKHVAAVQRHFPESFNPVPFDDTPQNAEEIAVKLSSMPLPHDVVHFDARHHFVRIGQKILDAASQAYETQPIHLTPVLLDLETNLDQARSVSIMHKQLNIPPNQRSWPKTATVMSAQPKTKRRKHVDPYSRGEQSGKKAKADARTSR
jgi:hypothetical protein